MIDRLKFRGIVKLDTQNIVIYSSILKNYDDDDLVLSVSESDGVKQIKDAGYKLTDKDWDEIYRYSDQDDYYPWFNFSCERVEQCTGLRDKNGKLIYEHDFIRAINQDTKDRPDLQIGHIWVDEMGCRWIKFKTEELSWNDFCSLIDYDGTLTIEVIGNIHENADLIKVGEKC